MITGRLVADAALAAGADVGQAAEQVSHWTAIGMFGAFVAGTLWRTKWAAARTKSAADCDRWRRHHRLPDRPGHRWRLPAGRNLPGHLGGGGDAGPRRPDRLHRFSGGLTGHHLQIAQMVGAGQLFKLLLGRGYRMAVVVVRAVMMIDVLFGGMTATTGAQIIRACLLLAGVTCMAILVMAQFGFSPEALLSEGPQLNAQIAQNSRRRPTSRCCS